MTLKIERSEQRGFTIFTLTGRLDIEHIPELENLFGPRTDYRKIIADLKELRFADRAAVTFLSRCEMAGLRVENCPEYIREWMQREKNE
jgi:hypothetical protein